MYYGKSSKFLLLVPIIVSLFLYNVSFSQTTDKGRKVNILTWWGYLNYPEIATLVNRQCGLQFSYDTYYSNAEFLQRFNSNKAKYDIIIFSDTIYSLLKEKVALKRSDLVKNINSYHPVIKRHYLTRKYPNNVVYFAHSLSGFMWNKKVIDINEGDSITEIFSKANRKGVILLNDSVELWNLLNRGYRSKHLNWSYKQEELLPLTLNTYKELIKDSNVNITNYFNKLYMDDKFAFSFMWSGDAINYINTLSGQYDFLIHPKLSYISTDLIANLNNSIGTSCVANVLASKQAIDVVQKSGFYFSPYGDFHEVKNAAYHRLYSKMYSKLEKILWLVPVDKKTYNEINKAWYEIQTYANERVYK